MTVTENYRTNSQLEALVATLQRVAFVARTEEGSAESRLREIVRQVESVEAHLLALTSAESDQEINELVSRKNAL